MESAPQSERDPPPARLAIWRGVRFRCPQCGARTLFRAYLKLAPACAACGADFSAVETADIAPYGTVFIIGLFAVPSLLFIGTRAHVPPAVLTPVAVGAVIAAVLLLLPRVKGALAGLFWLMRRSGAM